MSILVSMAKKKTIESDDYNIERDHLPAEGSGSPKNKPVKICREVQLIQCILENTQPRRLDIGKDFRLGLPFYPRLKKVINVKQLFGQASGSIQMHRSKYQGSCTKFPCNRL